MKSSKTVSTSPLAKEEQNVIHLLFKTTTIELGEFRKEIAHALNVIEWLTLFSSPKLPNLRLAALLHDCDRMFIQWKVRKENFPSYELYKRAHAAKSATIAKKILIKSGVPLKRILEITNDISDHEWGTTSTSKILMSADSLSYFTVNILDYYHQRGSQSTYKKIVFMYQRLSPRYRRILQKNIPEALQSVPSLHALFIRATKEVDRKPSSLNFRQKQKFK